MTAVPTPPRRGRLATLSRWLAALFRWLGSMAAVRLLLILSVLILAWTALMFTYRLTCVVVFFGLLVLAVRKPVRVFTAHGTARFANSTDLQAAGCFGDTGLPIGRVLLNRPRFWPSVWRLFDWRVGTEEAVWGFIAAIRKTAPATAIARLARSVHVMIVAPVGAGKSTGLIIPFLLEGASSCVVLDPKGELARATAEARRAMGHKVVLLDPFNVVTDTPDSFNPLAHVDWDSPQVLDELRAIAKEIVVRGGNEKDPHWNDRCEDVIYAMLAWLVTKEPKFRHLQALRDLVASEGLRINAIEELMKQ